MNRKIKLMYAAVLAASIAAPIAGFLGDSKGLSLTPASVQAPSFMGSPLARLRFRTRAGFAHARQRMMRTITAPTLIMTGDEDWPCLEPAILMKKTIPTAGLVVLPNAGHTINLEEPAVFNQHISDFLHAAELGRWPMRDPRAMASVILGK